jgi:hypothetical protein
VRTAMISRVNRSATTHSYGALGDECAANMILSLVQTYAARCNA